MDPTTPNPSNGDHDAPDQSTHITSPPPQPPLNPSHIVKLCFAFTASRTLHTALHLDLFTHIQNHPDGLTSHQLQQSLNLHPRSMPFFADTLVALNLLHRIGDEQSTAVYRNTPEGAAFLARGSDTSLYDVLSMGGSRLYGFWDGLPEAVTTGRLQNEARDAVDDGDSNYDSMYGNVEKVRVFQNAMKTRHMPAHRALAQKFHAMRRYNTLLDLGGGLGQLACEFARAHPHIDANTFDLVDVTHLARENVAGQAMEHKVQCTAGDFFADDFSLPSADVVVLSTVLHGHDLKTKKRLLRTAYDLLHDGGALLVVESLIDDGRRVNVEALLMSLNMLIETPGGFDFSAKDLREWALPIGFRDFEVLELVHPMQAVVAYK